MRKFFKDYSFFGVVLVCSVLFFGFSFRILSLSDVSAWGDEVASFYYSQHLDRSFIQDSHTPFSYFIYKLWLSVFPKTILSLRYLSIFFSICLTSLSSILLFKKRGYPAALFFFILWWLWPTDIIFSRQARHYSLYAEMMFLLLILWDQRSCYSRKMLFLFLGLIQFIHPFSILPILFIVIYDFVKKKSRFYESIGYLLTSLPVVIYYGVRFFRFGSDKVLSNISWISYTSFAFLKSLGLLFLGDSYPLTNVFPLSWVLGLFMIFLVMFTVMFQKGFVSSLKSKENFLKFFQLFLLTLIFVELSSFFFTNIRISRYYIYLVPFFLYALLDWVQDYEIRQTLYRGVLLAGVLVSYNLFVFQPWRTYTWDDQNVSEFKSHLELLAPRELVVCAQEFQQDYYLQKKYQNCTDQALKLHLNKKSFYLFDLTGNDKLLALFLLNTGHIDRYQKFNQSMFLSVTYPQTAQ